MKKLIITLFISLLSQTMIFACPNITLQFTSGTTTSNNLTPQQFKITNLATSNSYVIITQPNNAGLQTRGGYVGTGFPNCGPALDYDICYQIQALNVPNEPTMTIKFNTTSPWSFLTINYNLGVFYIQGGNPNTYQLNQCKICNYDLVIGPDPSYSTPLTECDTWIITYQQVIINPLTDVVLDASPSNGHIDLNPGFVSEPSSNNFFLAQLLDGCGTKNPGAKLLSLKMNLQGYWNGVSMSPVLLNQGINNNPTITDWVNVELRNPISPFDVVAYNAGLLQTNGIVEIDFNQSIIGNYYLALKHRNHIETWSSQPIIILPNTSYDFTTNDSKAYGNNQIEVTSNIWAFYSADINQDGLVDNGDYTPWELNANNFESGYLNTDLNGDGFVDNGDYIYWEANSNSFIGAIKP